MKLGKDEYVIGLSGEVGLCEGIRNLMFYINFGKYGFIGKFEYNNYISGFNVIDLEICDWCGFGGFYGFYNLNGLLFIGIYVSFIVSFEMVVECENIWLRVFFNSSLVFFKIM